MKIAIIGAGVAGLACARRLTKAGHAPVIYDKGRGIGGRMATRRVGDDLQFDHGARFFTATDPAFQAVVEDAITAGKVAPWKVSKTEPHYVGVPGMTGLAKHLAGDITRTQQTELRQITRAETGWSLVSEAGTDSADRVISTIPAPQLVTLLSTEPAITDAASQTAYAPCLTLMAALETTKTDLPPFLEDAGPPLASILRDSAKPQRPDRACWVAHANATWSMEHLERDKDAIRDLMLPHFLDRIGASESDLRYATAHRWRYAHVTTPLGRPFVATQDRTLYAGGDWCLGGSVEAAWQSGTAIADDLLATM